MSLTKGADILLEENDDEQEALGLPDMSRYEITEDKLPIGHFAMRPTLEEK